MGLDYTPMPEGHVIHRLAQHLNREFTDTSPIVTSPQGRFDAQARTLDGQPYLESDAYGKHLFIEFDVSQPERIIYIHLGLIGSLHFEDPAETKGQIRLHMATDTIAANLRGPQWCRLITAEEKAVAVDKLGADPLRADADPEPIKEKVNKSSRSIASLLMDQSLFPGVGNIYRAETLFRLGIDPFSSGKDADFDAIWADLVQLMAEGVKAGRIDTFLLSSQHRESTSLEEVREIISKIMKESAEEMNLNTDFRILVNPTGRFVLGSSFADSGLTGRKIIADTYGGAAHHGGGAFSGKDPSKVDRSAAYMARKIARDIVLSGRAERCEVQLAYAIGVAEPVSVYLDCFGSAHENVGNIWSDVVQNYELTPKAIIERLCLREVDYNLVSSYGHFGKPELPWEQ